MCRFAQKVGSFHLVTLLDLSIHFRFEKLYLLYIKLDLYYSYKIDPTIYSKLK